MSSETRCLVKLSSKNIGLAKKIAEIILLVGGFEIQKAADSRRPDLLIHDLTGQPGEELDTIQMLLETQRVDQVFLTGESPDADVLMKAMRIGVKEFFSQPIKEQEVKKALQRFRETYRENSSLKTKKKGKVIGVFGCKGGVGTTTVAVNLATSFTRNGTEITSALLDMNMVFGEIPLFLEMSPKFHWGEITKNTGRLDDIFLSNILEKHPSGVSVLSSPAHLNGHIEPTPAVMTKLLGLMRQMFDHIVIDVGQSTNDTALKVFEAADAILLVTTPSLPCLTNTSKLITSLKDMGYFNEQRLKVILNRYIKKGDISLEDVEAGIGQEVFWTIPNDFRTTMSAINNGKPLFGIAPKAAITKNFLELAGEFNDPEENKPPKKWRLFRR
jgi:pilus assembly protein CpaE